MTNLHNYSIVPPSAVFQDNWPSTAVFTQGLAGSLSVAGWTSGNEGYQHQSFLGASIRSFNVNAGFGDSSSTMGIELVNDEFNKSDNEGFGFGDDVYHNGVHDNFNPPVVGAPVFFKFGKNFADVEQAFRRDFDQIYETDTLNMPADPFPIVNGPYPIETHPGGYYLMDSNPQAGTSRWVDKTALLDPSTKWRGFAHFTFGGILQSYTENRSSAGNPLYSVKLTDPREILTNTEMILNNYQGTTFDNKNLFNIYGFLEYDPSDALVEQFELNMMSKSVLEKNVSDTGEVTYVGRDEYEFYFGTEIASLDSVTTFGIAGEDGFEAFPITGQGFSRRGDNGIPWYRVEQAMKSLFSYTSELPEEYRLSGFGGVIDFRGYNYVVDWSGIPTEDIPKTYYLDFDNLNMLDLAQELCDILSRELFVSLLPVIDHPSCSFLHQKNLDAIEEAGSFEEGSSERSQILGSKLIAGIIRLDSIDKKKQPRYGAVKQYLDNLELNDIFVENRDVGFEVSNVTTDKFVVGAQEVDMYYFNNLRDRDNYLERLRDTGGDEGAEGQARLEQLGHDKWTLDTNLKQQILPFYGFIGDQAVTIPRGFGSYQQILLDARGLDAHGVGSYYVATEMELRAATISYTMWQNFLLTYNEVYIQELSENQYFFSSLGIDMTSEVKGINDQLDEEEGAFSPLKEQLSTLTKEGRDFGVSVPRSVWNSDKSPKRESHIEIDPDTEEVATDENGEAIITMTGGPFEGKMGKDGYPASPCNPPFGYPLYYKRAEKIGIPQAGLTQIMGSYNTVLTNIGNLENMTRSDKQRFSYVKSMAEASIRRLEALVVQKIESKEKSTAQKIEAINQDIVTLNARIVTIRENVAKEREEIKKLRDHRKVQIAQLKTVKNNSMGFIKNIATAQRDSLRNARKVYSFVKKIADDNLGKKFLVKIPRACNVNWSAKIKKKNDEPWDVIRGPFGFKPQPISSTPGYDGDQEWKDSLKEFKRVAKKAERTGPTAAEMEGSLWPTKSNIHWHYLDLAAMGQASVGDGGFIFRPKGQRLTENGSGYTYGALKCNFNPMSEKWEHNYKPEPQGGFFNYALFDKNLKAEELDIDGISDTRLPRVTRNMFAPKLMDKIISDGNRVKCYARYDHSQHLDFGQVSSASVEQQRIGEDGGSIIPDVMETCPNLKPDKKEFMNNIGKRLEDDKEGERQEQSVAFVQCEIDERFYMAPKHLGEDSVVWAEDFTVNLAPTPYEVVYVEDTDETSDNFGCKVPKEVKRRPIPSFGVKDGGLLNSDGKSSTTETDDEGIETVTEVTTKDAHREPWDDFEREYSKTYKGWIIKTKEKDLDPEHVYALITVPGRITPTVSKRYVDGPAKILNGAALANAMTEDVVKIDEFGKPGIDNEGEVKLNCDAKGLEDLTFQDINRALHAQKELSKGFSLSQGNNSNMAFVSPSPIYPDLVALPLMSLERCYGPWISSALDGNMLGLGDVRFSEIGGKIEFQKDEGLAPWSFAGYQLMDESAKMKTKFSNSLMLFSERGSFSYADAPIDVSLAKALLDKGPLVTSISVSVGASIKTSVKLDLYTSQFGKLQKQKELAIAQISRERQKTIDQNNLLKRRGIGKGAANMNMLGTLMEQGGQKLLDAAKNSSEIFTELEKGNVKKANMITISATSSTETFDNNEDGTSTSIASADSEGALQSDTEIQEMASFSDDFYEAQEKYNKTAGATITDVFAGVSDDPYDPNFASRPVNRRSSIDKRTLG